MGRGLTFTTTGKYVPASRLPLGPVFFLSGQARGERKSRPSDTLGRPTIRLEPIHTLMKDQKWTWDPWKNKLSCNNRTARTPFLKD